MANNIVRNSDKNWTYSGYVIMFDSADSWSFKNDSARSDIIFGVYNSSLSHDGIRKNNF